MLIKFYLLMVSPNALFNPLKESRIINLPSIRDNRGILTAIEAGQDIPFQMARVFFMHHISAERGGHAHRDTDQVIIATSGSFEVELSDGKTNQKHSLSDPTCGLYVARMTFTRLYDFSKDAVCMVLASTHYDMSKSIRTWDEYLNIIGAIQ